MPLQCTRRGKIRVPLQPLLGLLQIERKGCRRPHRGRHAFSSLVLCGPIPPPPFAAGVHRLEGALPQRRAYSAPLPRCLVGPTQMCTIPQTNFQQLLLGITLYISNYVMLLGVGVRLRARGSTKRQAGRGLRRWWQCALAEGSALGRTTLRGLTREHGQQDAGVAGRGRRTRSDGDGELEERSCHALMPTAPLSSPQQISVAVYSRKRLPTG